MKKHLPKLIRILSLIAPKMAAKIAIKVFATPTRIPRPESEMEAYRLSKKFTLTTGIAAFEWGDPHAPLVMLVHGWNGRGTQIAAFAQSLVEKNFRVVALDGPGHGDSPAGPNGMTNPAHFAQFIIDSQKELAPMGAHAIIAHSFGGGCAVLATERGLDVKKIILIASPAFYERVVDFFAASFGLNESAKKEFVRLIIKIAGIHPKDLNIGVIGSQLKKPCLIVHDVGDNAVNYLSATAIKEAWPDSKLLTTEGLGHRRILKDSKVIAEVSDFISA